MTLRSSLRPSPAPRPQPDSMPTPAAPEPRAWHPWLLAAVPIASLAAGCFYELHWADLLWPLVAIAALVGLAFLTLRGLGFSRARTSLGVSLFLIAFFGYRIFRDSLQVAAFVAANVWVPATIIVALWFAIVLAGLFWIRRAHLSEAAITRLLNTVAVMLLVVVAGRFLLDLASYPFLLSLPAPSAEHTAQEQAIESALATAAALPLPSPARDIYYLVFDRYGSQRTLAEEFDFDNEPFLAELRRRGFIVAENSRSNYPQTLLSMSAALNLGYHDHTVSSHRHYANRIAEYRLGRWLKDQGYILGHFGNWHQPFRSSPQARVVFPAGLLPSEFSEALCASTPLAEFLPLPGAPQPILDQFAALEAFAADTPGPKFAYAHFLLPHPPFVFDADGAYLENRVACRRTLKENYRNQLQFTNNRLLQLIDHIQASSNLPPIIIVQADEGPYLQPSDQSLARSRKLAKRIEIISAMSLPGLPDAAAVVPSDITPVNTFRLVLREYFHVPLPPLPQRNFYWESPTPEGSLNWRSPGNFVEVTQELNKPPRARGNSAGDSTALLRN